MLTVPFGSDKSSFPARSLAVINNNFSPQREELSGTFIVAVQTFCIAGGSCEVRLRIPSDSTVMAGLSTGSLNFMVIV
jgi:hypothetical protein